VTIAVSDTQDLLRFGVFELNLATGELRKSGMLIKLSPQPFKLLTLLASRSGQVVSREEIQQKLWGEETYVDFEQGMNHCVKQIRNALSDSADTPLYIETIPRRGYRFLAPVVSKTILAPPPRVVESQSGIQTKVPLPAVIPVQPPTTVSAKAISDTPATQVVRNPVVVATPPPPVESAPVPIAVTPVTPVTPPKSRLPWIALAVGVLVLVAAVVGFLIWRSHRPPPLSERDTIVVADFENTTGEPVFDNALKQALTFDLEQSPFLNVLSDQKVNEQLGFMRMAADTRLSENVARQVCQRSASKAMLVGSISGVSGRYLIGLKAIDCATGDEIDSERAEAASRDKVLHALGKATTKMREKLGESLASLQKYDIPIEEATTSSLDALKAYSLAQKMRNTQGYAAAVPYLKSAIDLDPNFAMAYARLGVEYFNLNQPTLAAEYTTKAYQLRHHTSEREKLYITSHYHDLVTGNADQTIVAYQLLQQAYPREEASYMNLNNWFNSIGKYDEAFEQAKDALRLDSGNVINYHNLALSYIDLNRVDDAQAVLNQAKARNLDDPALQYEIAFLRGDTDAMTRQVAAAMGQPGVEDQLLALQSDSEAYFGRLHRARELTDLAQASARHTGASETAALWILSGALHDAELGDPKQARSEAEDALKTSSGKNVQILAALVLARSGDRVRVESLLEPLVRQYPADTLVNDYWIPTIRAALALEEKNPGAAIEALATTSPYEIGSPPPGIAFYPVYLRGLAHLQQGEGSQATVEFQKMLRYRGVILNLTIAALAHLQLARAQQMSGDIAAARKSYEEFLELWKTADPRLPILKQAKEEYGRP
jgi:eukaryotic-like serine/threonine-protein kinase